MMSEQLCVIGMSEAKVAADDSDRPRFLPCRNLQAVTAALGPAARLHTVAESVQGALHAVRELAAPSSCYVNRHKERTASRRFPDDLES
jgi:hypothetical protein